MTTLGHDRFAAELPAQAAGFAEAVAGADLEQRVPTCPEWTLAQLVAHVGGAHRWAGAIVARRASEFVPLKSVEDLDVPDGAAARSAWLVAGAALLVDAVAEAGPQTRVWTWADEQTAGFWLRRMTYETAVHRADVEFALGRPFALAPDLAADGIDEWLGFLASPQLAAYRPSGAAELCGDGQSLHFHATDRDLGEGLGEAGEWFVQRTPAGVVWEHGHRKADVAVRASAADLFLAIVCRIPPTDPRIEVLGDEKLLQHWLDHTAF